MKNNLILQTLKSLAKKEAFAQSDDLFYFTLCCEMLTAIPEPENLKGKFKQDWNKLFEAVVKYCDSNIESITINPDMSKEMTPKAKQEFIKKSKDNFWKLAGNLLDKSNATIPEVLILIQVRFDTMVTKTGKIHAQKVYNLSKQMSKHYPEYSDAQKLKIVQTHKKAVLNADIEIETID